MTIREALADLLASHDTKQWQSCEQQQLWRNAREALATDVEFVREPPEVGQFVALGTGSHRINDCPTCGRKLVESDGEVKREREGRFL